MNINDYVYVHLFDLEKALVGMERLREDRFGRIVDKKIIPNIGGNDVIAYSVCMIKTNKVIQVRSDNVSTSIISIHELIETIGKARISSEKRNELLDQINDVVRD